MVTGGGAALVAAAQATQELHLQGDERVGARVREAALQTPMRTLAERGGFDPDAVVRAARERGPGWTFDASAGDWVEPDRGGGPLDPVLVVDAAVEVGVSAACSALSTGALVRKRGPDRSWA